MADFVGVSSNDLPPMRWSSAKSAFRWAIETASRPDYRSPAAVMIADLDKGKSNWKPEDFRDLAYSILTVVANIEDPFAREMFRYVYGAGYDRLQSLGGLIGESLQATYPAKSCSKLRRIGETSVLRERIYAESGKKIGLTWYARALGIQRPSLYDGCWLEIIRASEESAQSVLDRGSMLARYSIADLGVLS